MNKKGIESVEVWMWLVAGLVIGGLIFVSGYTLLSQWFHTKDIDKAMQNYAQLRDSLVTVCKVGSEHQEIKRFEFPRIVTNISIIDKPKNLIGQGSTLCMEIEGEDILCTQIDKEPYTCKLPLIMKTFDTQKKKGLFAMIDRALGDSQVSKIEFSISKNELNLICITPQEYFDSASVQRNIAFAAENEICDSTCNCASGLLCDNKINPGVQGHCCMPGYYFITGQCTDPRGNGVCEIMYGENCASESGCSCASSGTCCAGCSGTDNIGCCAQPKIACGNTCIDNPTTKKPNNEQCQCDLECDSNNCAANPDNPQSKACCMAGYYFDGSVCRKRLIVLAVGVNIDSGNMNYYRERAQRDLGYFASHSPFKEDKCKNGLKINILDRNCDAPACEWNYVRGNGAAGCMSSVLNCVSDQDFDYIASISDDNIQNGFASVPSPFAICYGGLPAGLEIACLAHELGHQLKLCDLYSRSTYDSQNLRFPSWQLFLEPAPYSGCGHSWASSGIGPANACNVDCATNPSACVSDTCGEKISGSAPPYGTSIMGGGGNIGSGPGGMVGNPIEYEPESYSFMLNKLTEAGYCEP
ncbi:MAG: hypothetical protein V1859_09310 [archaeon]